MCDRIAVMLEGHVEQLGDPETIYERPASAFVAAFIGQNNFWQGAATERRDAGRDGTVSSRPSRRGGRAPASRRSPPCGRRPCRCRATDPGTRVNVHPRARSPACPTSATCCSTSCARPAATSSSCCPARPAPKLASRRSGLVHVVAPRRLRVLGRPGRSRPRRAQSTRRARNSIALNPKEPTTMHVHERTV